MVPANTMKKITANVNKSSIKTQSISLVATMNGQWLTLVLNIGHNHQFYLHLFTWDRQPSVSK